MKMKFLKSVLCVLAVAALVAVGVPAEKAEAAGKVTTMAATEGVYMRSGPGTNYGTVGSIPKGGVCQVFSMTKDGWYKVKYNGTTGYSYYKYINWEGTDSNCINDGNFTVMYATADLKIRKEPDVNSQQVGSIPSGSGAKVSNKQNGWFKVDYNGTKGWSSGEYLDFGQDASDGKPAPAPAPAGKTMYTTCGLNMRSAADNTASVILVIPQNAAVTATADKYGWYKVEYNGKSGYSYGAYLTEKKPSGGNSGSSTPASQPKTNDKTGNTTYMYATGDVYMRSGPAKTYGVVTTVPGGAQVVCSGNQDGWYKITYNGKTGWTSGKFLANEKGGTGVVVEGPLNWSMTTLGDVYMRSGPAKTYGAICVVPQGKKLHISEGKDGWYKCEYNGKVGWISGRFLK